MKTIIFCIDCLHIVKFCPHTMCGIGNFGARSIFNFIFDFSLQPNFTIYTQFLSCHRPLLSWGRANFPPTTVMSPSSFLPDSLAFARNSHKALWQRKTQKLRDYDCIRHYRRSGGGLTISIYPSFAIIKKLRTCVFSLIVQLAFSLTLSGASPSKPRPPFVVTCVPRGKVFGALHHPLCRLPCLQRKKRGHSKARMAKEHAAGARRVLAWMASMNERRPQWRCCHCVPQGEVVGASRHIIMSFALSSRPPGGCGTANYHD